MRMSIDAESNLILQFVILRSLGIIVLYSDMDASFNKGMIENIPHRKPGSQSQYAHFDFGASNHLKFYL